MKTFREWIRREWAEWQIAWREVRDDRDKHEECISVPLSRHCELLQAEQRCRRLAAELAHEGRVTDVLGTAIFAMTEQGSKEDAAAEAEGFMLETRRFSQAEMAPYFRVVPKRGMDS